MASKILKVLDRFNQVFAVLDDTDEKFSQDAISWAQAEGRWGEISPEIRQKFGTERLTDAAIDALIAERTLAKKQRNFARADALRNELLEKGILLEDSKEGARWKRQ